jgi:hypothetical protein
LQFGALDPILRFLSRLGKGMYNDDILAELPMINAEINAEVKER